MKCKQCRKEIDFKLESMYVDTLTIRAFHLEVEERRIEFLNSLKKDLNLIINEKNEELATTCSNACFNKLLYNEYLRRLNSEEIGHEFYEEKLEYTKKLIENYN